MHGAKVLVADNQPSSRELLRILLEYEGCEVSEATDGLQAVSMARTILPDMILLDLDLPVLSAYGAAREIRRDPRLRDRSIFVLSDSRDNDIRGANAGGFTGYITKPVARKVLAERLAGVSTPA